MELAAIVLDVDGTLLTSEHRIDGTTREAIAAAQHAGKMVILASARGPAELWPIVDELDLAGPLVTYCGALVLDVKRPRRTSVVCFERRIRRSSASSVVAEASRLGLEIGWHADERWYAPAIGDGLRREAAITGQHLESLVDEGACAAPHKLLGIADPTDGLGRLQELRRRLPPDCQGHHSYRHYLEITACGVHKAAAVMRICEREAISIKQVAAIGDGENDIGLLRLAGTGVAMGQAGAQIHAAADWVTDTNDRDGVALAIERLLSGRSADLASAPCC